MKRSHVLSALAVMGLTANVSAHADDDTGFYLGAGIGEVTDKAGDFESDGVGVRFFGGYAFSKYFATEAEFLYAGVLRDTIDDVELEVESDGFIFAALGQLPLGQAFSLFAKLGYTFYDEKVSAKQGNLSASEKNSDADLVYGAGARLDLGRTFQLRAEYEVVDVPDADFNMLSINAGFRF